MLHFFIILMYRLNQTEFAIFHVILLFLIPRDHIFPDIYYFHFQVFCIPMFFHSTKKDLHTVISIDLLFKTLNKQTKTLINSYVWHYIFCLSVGIFLHLRHINNSDQNIFNSGQDNWLLFEPFKRLWILSHYSKLYLKR
jgi:hypothetical protein